MLRVTVSVLYLLVFPMLVDAADDPPRSAGELLVGWGSADITPDGPVALAGQYHARITSEVHDRVTATALAVETRSGDDSIDHAVIVSCDLVAMRRVIVERVRARVAGRTPGLDPKKIIVAATHTHTAPVTTYVDEDSHPYDFQGIWAYRLPKSGLLQPKGYLDFLVERLADAVTQAWTTRAPGAMSRGLGYAAVAHNRRAVFKDGTTRMYGRTSSPDFRHIEGVSDSRIDLLFLWDTEKQLSGLAINVSCPSQEVEGERYVSADFWHDVRIVLRERHGAALQILPLTGAAGDQSPHVMWGRKTERERLARAGITATRAIALRIVRTIDQVLAGNREPALTSLVLRHHVAMMPLPVREVLPDRRAAALEELQAGRSRFAELQDRAWMTFRVSQALLERTEYRKEHPDYFAEVHALRLGDVALATNPFELYTDYGIRMEAQSPADQTMIVQLACESAGYLPTPRAVAGGGYSARVDDGIVGPAGGEALVEQTVALLNGLWNDEAGTR
jgi:hypothetical protein